MRSCIVLCGVFGVRGMLGLLKDAKKPLRILFKKKSQSGFSSSLSMSRWMLPVYFLLLICLRCLIVVLCVLSLVYFMYTSCVQELPFCGILMKHLLIKKNLSALTRRWIEDVCTYFACSFTTFFYLQSFLVPLCMFGLWDTIACSHVITWAPTHLTVMLWLLQISRDCQELEPPVGEQLASLLYLEPDSELMVCSLFYFGMQRSN